MAMDPAHLEQQLTGLNTTGNCITAPIRTRTLISIIGSSHIKRVNLEEFPETYQATSSSYNARITNVYYKDQIRYIINYRPKATAVVLMFGGNDIAFKGFNKSSDNEIIDSF
ncbi:unnamed protein product, partial [Meganyctiphanes norvegica]